jgi:hypothetical protein
MKKWFTINRKEVARLTPNTKAILKIPPQSAEAPSKNKRSLASSAITWSREEDYAWFMSARASILNSEKAFVVVSFSNNMHDRCLSI